MYLCVILSFCRHQIYKSGQYNKEDLEEQLILNLTAGKKKVVILLVLVRFAVMRTSTGTTH